MNHRFLISIIISCFALFNIAPAQNAGSGKSANVLRLSLEQAQAYASENNYDLRNSATDVEIAGKMVKQNTAIGLPQISAGVDYMDYIQTPTTVIPNFLLGIIPDSTGRSPKTLEMKLGMKYSVSAKVSLSQLIYSGQYLVGLQTAKAFLETSKQKNLKDKVDVRDRVADAYMLLLVIDQGLEILDSTYVVVNRLVNEARISFQNGLIEDIDVDQAELNRSNLEAIVTDTRNARNVAYAGLKFIIGLKDGQECVLTDNLNFFLAQVDRDALIAQPFDYRNNIDYTLLKKSDYLVLMQYKLSKTAYQPTLAGFFSYAQNAQRDEWNFFKSSQSWFNPINWGLSLSIPIWSSGSRKNKKKGFETALKIYEKTTIKYQQGLSSSTDLNQRYSQFLQTNSDYMQSIYTVLSSKIKLTKLLEKF
ncbi:MAG: TolC family protein [Bacteroidetes bacterium]|nr:TolC family protein [Bacteroidota bacterium]